MTAAASEHDPRVISHSSPRRDPARTLAGGFGLTAAMWAVGYFLHLPGLQTPPGLTLGLLVGVLLSGGFWLGRCAGLAVAARAGVLAGVLNLLVLGSLLVDPESGALRQMAWLFVPTFVLACGGLTALGASFAKPANAISLENARLLFACIAVATTLLLLSAGGAVTGFEAGLAVPDWPNSFGYNMFLYPLTRMTGGIYYEHAHRLLGSLVGLTTVTLAIYLQFVERRAWVRGLAIFAIVAVVAQGVMGGLRVTGRPTLSAAAEDLAPNLTLAIVHGVFAQIFFALMTGLAVALAPAWRAERPTSLSPAARVDVRLGLAALLVILLQTTLGAFYRHTHATWALHTHLVGAFMVVGTAAALALRAWGLYGPQAVALLRLGTAVFAAIFLQIVLGFAALLAVGLDSAGRPSPGQVFITTLHQTTGAILLAATVVLTLWHVPSSRAQTADVLTPRADSVTPAGMEVAV